MTTPRRRLAASLETPDDPPVTSIMATRVSVVPPDTDLTVALRLMTSLHVHHLPVIEVDGRYLGVIEDSELAHHLARGLGLPYSGWLRVGALVRRAVPVPPTPGGPTRPDRCSPTNRTSFLSRTATSRAAFSLPPTSSVR
jgi:hypothetical protein